MHEAGELALSGDVIRASYTLRSGAKTVKEAARELCIEQTVEFPMDLIERQDIRQKIVGRVEDIKPIDDETHLAEIQFPVEVAGSELTQLLNVLFGNSSLKPGIRLVDIELPASLLANFSGPRFGRQGLRDLLDAPTRPLIATALKPMGLSPPELARLASRYASSGIDVIKDDHGLADQAFCPYAERVARCSEAVLEANERTGSRCLYFPNITAGARAVFERAEAAKSAGAGGLVISPGLTGLDTMACLAADGAMDLPLMSHPALQGAFTTSANEGIAHVVIYGLLNRLAGADVVIFPSYGGRFTFSEEDCRKLVAGTARPFGELKPSFPAPAGGMTLERVPEMLRFYGRDVILLIGGDLHRAAKNLEESCRRFVDLVR